MVIRVFVLGLLVLASLSYFIPVENKDKKSAQNDIPLLTFSDSTMYTLTTDSMNRIVHSKSALRYKDRDVMHEGALLIKGVDKENNEISDTLTADVIIKRAEAYKFLNDVKFRRNDYITLNTDELLYNAETKVATNTLPFEGTYFNNYIKGKNIYLDLDKYYMKAEDSHFEIEVQEKKGK